MVDREFIGEEWFNGFINKKIFFYIRVKVNMKIIVLGKGEKKVFWLFNYLKVGIGYYYKGIVYIRGN